MELAFGKITLAFLWRMNWRGCPLSRSGTLAVKGLLLVEGDSSLDRVMVADVEEGRKLRDLGGKQVDFIRGWLQEVEGRKGHR